MTNVLLNKTYDEWCNAQDAGAGERGWGVGGCGLDKRRMLVNVLFSITG